MARIQGRLGRVAVSDDGGASYVDVGCIQDATLNGSLDEIEVTCHESGTVREYLQGRRDATLDLTIWWDEDDPGQDKISAAYFGDSTLKVRFRMEEAAGKDEIIADAFVTSYTENSPNDDAASLDVSMRITGAFSPSAQP